MGLGGVAIATLPSVIFPKLMFSDRLGGGGSNNFTFPSFLHWEKSPCVNCTTSIEISSLYYGAAYMEYIFFGTKLVQNCNGTKTKKRGNYLVIK